MKRDFDGRRQEANLGSLAVGEKTRHHADVDRKEMGKEYKLAHLVQSDFKGYVDEYTKGGILRLNPSPTTACIAPSTPIALTTAYCYRSSSVDRPPGRRSLRC